MPFLIALGLATLTVPLAAIAGRRLGIVDRPGTELKIHARAIPLTGGIAVVLCAWITWAVMAGFPEWGATVAIGLALTTGVVDDVRPLPAWSRMVALIACGVALATGGFPSGVASSPFAVAGVVLLVLACTQAVNLIDGQDGLAGGLGLIAALGLGGLAWLFDAGETIAPLALAGALAGFLVHNRPPARIFLGNGGAYALGTSLASLVVPLVATEGFRGVLAAGACLGVFAFELCFTVLRRVLGRAPLSTGDRLHSYDLIAKVLAGRERSTLVFLGAGLVALGVASAAAVAPLEAAAALAIGASAVATAIGLLLWRAAGVRTTVPKTQVNPRRPKEMDSG